MATVKIPLSVLAATPASTNGAAHKTFAGTNFPIRALAFDAATEEAVFWQFRAASYGSGNLTLKLLWYADSASSGDVIWGAQLAAITPNTDSQDPETDALATANTVTDTHLGTVGQRFHECSITISNLDSVAAGDFVALQIYRDANAGGDTMANDALLVGVELTYSDT
jgi:hypothetical protein